MSKRPESDFAEVAVDRLLMESFSNESSAYYRESQPPVDDKNLKRLKKKLKWHVTHSLSHRQRQVLTLYLSGKKQSEIVEILGVTKQVVSIYKLRAINKLRKVIRE